MSFKANESDIHKITSWVTSWKDLNGHMKSGWGRLLPQGCLSIFPTMSFILFKFWANKKEKWFPAASCLHGFTYIIYGKKIPLDINQFHRKIILTY